MKLRDDLLRELTSLVGTTNHQLSLTDGLRTLHCHIDQCDGLGAAVSEFTLASMELAAVDINALSGASSALCHRVNYLLEPISPIEIDSTGCVVQMRSSPPRKDDEGVRYYELSMRTGGSVSLARFEKLPGNGRVAIPSLLTHEVLGRLTEDFSTAIDEALSH